METISPFELKNKLIDMADESIKKIAHTMLNAGRGNPNWIATEPREAFFLLGQFGLCECRHAFSLEEGIAGIPQKVGIAARFEAFLKENEKAPGANLLKEGYNYMLMEHAADPDTLIHEWAESVIGDQYPVPDRILHFTELIVQDYLAQEMCDRRPPKGTFDLFATEGGTAAIVLGLMLNLSEAFAGRRPEPGAVAQAEPAGGTHALWEPFSIHGTQQVTVEDPWEVDLTYVPLARREGFRCLAVDLWVEGGERRDDLTFFPAELRLEDGTALLAEDDASLARQLKDAGVYLVTLSDAQWEDPLYGQMIFFVPEDASGGAVLALYEGEPDSSTPSAVHQIPLELPWGAVGTV